MERRAWVLWLVFVAAVLFAAGCSKEGDKPKEKSSTETNQAAKANEPAKPAKSLKPAGKSTAVVFGKVPNADYDVFKDNLEKSGIFKEAMKNIEDAIALPANLTLQFQECGQVNAFYDPSNKTITVCYELFKHFAESFKDDVETEEELATAILNTTFFVFFHELGHALIDVLDLPVTGKEEDAVDQFSTLLLTIADNESEESLAISGAAWFQKSASDETGDDAFADEHPLDQQRYYNILCWLYGSNTEKYSYIVTDEYLPKERADRCEAEFARMTKAWDSLLKPYEKASE